MSRIKGYTQEWNKVLLALYGLINRSPADPIWIEDKKHWEVSEMRAMQAYVETLDGKKLPIKWVWRKILSPFGITQKDLSTSQIAHFFKDIGFKTGSFGKGEE